jgi:hypothetical protein
MCVGKVMLAALVSATAALAQNPIAADAPFQVRYAANLTGGESYIDITNTGAQGAPLLGPGFGGTGGNICVNVYAFDPNEEMIACCSCLVTPDQTVNLGVNADLTLNSLTGVPETSVTVKLLATTPTYITALGVTTSNCTNSAADVSAAGIISAGMAAWGTTLHPGITGAIAHATRETCPRCVGTIPLALESAGTGYVMTETPFTPATLSTDELASLGGRCASIIGNASGYGICTSCRVGALGGQKLH